MNVFLLRLRVPAAFLSSLLALGLFAWRASADSPSIAYDLSMQRPAEHIFSVKMTISGLARSAARIEMPIWFPGSYSADYFSRNVLTFAATDGNGHALGWHPDGDSAWVVSTQGISTLILHYDVYANRAEAQATQLAAQRAEFNGAQLFMYLKEDDGYPPPGPVTLSIHRPPGWDLQSGLLAMRTGDDVFTAPSYDVLLDCPTELAPHFFKSEFVVDGVPYHLVVDGSGTYDLKMLTTVAKSIAVSEVKMMGHAGFKQYWIIMETYDEDGVEHLNSQFSGMSAFGWEKQRDRDNIDTNVHPLNSYAFVVAHELFHSWNVKRIRPAVLGPFRYDRQVHTRRLDVAEGLTEYYTYVHMMRSGYGSTAAFWQTLADTIATEETSPGRKIMSLGDLSWRTWWRNDDPWIPALDYYDGGAAMGIMLDLKIRYDTNNTHSLDDVMRYLYRDWRSRAVDEYRSSGGTYTDDQMPAIIAAATGDREAGEMFHRWWDTTQLPDWNLYLHYAGLRLVKKAPKTGKADLGIQWQEVGTPEGVGFKPTGYNINYGIPSVNPDVVMIGEVSRGGPAARAGLEQYDVLQSLGGIAVTQQSLPGIIAAHKPGDRLSAVVVRENRQLTVSVTLAQAITPDYSIEEIRRATAEQRSLRADFVAGRPFSSE